MQLTSDQFALIKDQFKTLKERSPFYAEQVRGHRPCRRANPRGLREAPVLREGRPAQRLSAGAAGRARRGDRAHPHRRVGTTGTPVVIPYTQQDVIDWAIQFARCYETAGITQQRPHPHHARLRPVDGGHRLPAGRRAPGRHGHSHGAGQHREAAAHDAGLEVHRPVRHQLLRAAAGRGDRRTRHLATRYACARASSAASGGATRCAQRIAGELGVEIYDIYGLTEVYGPGIGISCDEHHGMHVWDDYVYMRDRGPDHRRTGARRRSGRARADHAAQAGRAAHPLPHARPHAHHPRRLPMRVRPSSSAHRYAHRPHRRHVQGEGLQHLPCSGGGGHQHHRRRIVRVPGDDRDTSCGKDVLTVLFETPLEGEAKARAEQELALIFKAKCGCTPDAKGVPMGELPRSREEDQAHLRQPVLEFRLPTANGTHATLHGAEAHRLRAISKTSVPKYASPLRSRRIRVHLSADRWHSNRSFAGESRTSRCANCSTMVK